MTDLEINQLRTPLPEKKWLMLLRSLDPGGRRVPTTFVVSRSKGDDKHVSWKDLN
jgi:hypothetical protein